MAKIKVKVSQRELADKISFKPTSKEKTQIIRCMLAAKSLPDLPLKNYAFSSRAVQKKKKQVQSNLEQAKKLIENELNE